MGVASLPLNLAIRGLASIGLGQRLCVLTYHRVLTEFDPLRPSEPTALLFDRQLSVLREHFNLMRLDRAVEALSKGVLPPRSLALTFDDGYLDNYEVALPILQRYGVQATFFVATGFANGDAMFNDLVIEAVRSTRRESIALPWLSEQPLDLSSIESRRASIGQILPALKKQPLRERGDTIAALHTELATKPHHGLMMVPDQIRGLHRAGMEVGGHTVNHPILLSLSDDESRREIAAGKAQLEEWLQTPIKSFAYPNGRPGRDYDGRHAQMVESCGFDYAVSTRWGSFSSGTARFEIPRIAPQGDRESLFALRIARAYRDN